MFFIWTGLKNLVILVFEKYVERKANALCFINVETLLVLGDLFFSSVLFDSLDPDSIG